MTTFAEFMKKDDIPENTKFITHNIDSNGYTKFVIFSYNINVAVQGFIVLRTWGEDSKGLLYEYEDEDGAILGLHDHNKSDVFMQGAVKWDGCSNWTFENQENCAIHFCGEEEAALLGTIMRAAYNITRDIIRTI